MRTLPLAMLIALGLLQVGCEEGGADPRIPEPEVEVLDSSPIQRPAKLLPVFDDISGSQNQDQLKEILPDIIDALKQQAAAVDGVEVIFFGNRGRSIWRESGRKFTWGAAPRFKDFDENKILSSAPKSSKMFTQNKEEYLRRARQRYEQEKERLTNEYHARVDKALKELKTYLLQQPDRFPDCTRFKSLAARIERDKLDACLAVTDGWADCADERSGAITPTDTKRKLVILQLTKKTDSQADDEAFLQRQGFLHSLFPSAHIFPAYQAREAMQDLFN